MYFLLIEAAGAQQIARIYPERHDSLLRAVSGAMEDGGFDSVHRDGDLLLYTQRNGVRIDPPAIARLGRDLLDILRNRVEDLVDFAVIIDYDDGAAAAERIVPLRKLLRFARSPNALYLTPAVHRAVEPLVDAEQHGGLFFVRTVHEAVERARQPYAAALRDERVVTALTTELTSHDPRPVWVRCADTATVVASLPEALGTMYHIEVQCRPDSSVDGLLQAVTAQMPDFGSGESGGGAAAASMVPDEVARRDRSAVAVLRERFSRPATHLLSEGWRRGELALILERTLSRLVDRDERVAVVLRDVDRAMPHVTEELAAHLTHRAVRPIAITTEDGPTGWRTVRIGPDGEPDRYAAARAYWSRPGTSPDALPENHRRTLYLLHRLRGALDDAALNEFFPAIGITLAERARIFAELAELGLVVRLWTVEVHPAVDAIAADLVDAADRARIDETIVTLLEAQIESGSLSMSPPIWRFLEQLLTGAHRLHRRHAMLHMLAGGAAFRALERVIAYGSSGSPFAGASEASARIRLYLRDSRGPEQCRRDFEQISRSTDDAALPIDVRADLLLSAGEFLLADRQYGPALEAAKGATILHQRADPNGLGASHLLMARILLAQRRLGEAGQYLSFAREEAGTDRATELIARTLEAARLFLVGNLTRAATQFEELTDPLLRSGFSEWLMLAWFALGRIDCELGEYHRAAAQFRMTRDWAASCGMEQPARTVAAWVTRAEILGEERVAALPEDRDGATAEELLFVAEGLIRDGRHDQALVLLEEAEQREGREDRWPRLGVCWDNGFAPLEDLIIADRAGNSELLRIVRAFRAWMLGVTGRQDEAFSMFYGLTRGNDGIVVDPYAGLYNYLYSSILPRERSSDRDDRITVLGKSVKLVQERMSRIDDYRDKTRYLRDNTWNRRVMESAREHNLM